jgi:hypothetical protein
MATGAKHTTGRIFRKPIIRLWRDLAQLRRAAAAPEPTNRLALLVRRQLRFVAELDAARPGPLTAFPDAGADQIALELGEAAENGQHQVAVRRGGFGLCVAQGSEAWRPDATFSSKRELRGAVPFQFRQRPIDHPKIFQPGAGDSRLRWR